MMETEHNRANPDTQFDVDIMILDYFVCTAVNAMLKARIAERHGQAHSWDVEGLLLLFDTFKSISSAHHSKNLITRDLEAKLQLITFASLFFHRYLDSIWSRDVAELNLWREKNRQNAMEWMTNNEDKELFDHSSWTAFQALPADPSILARNYQAMLLQLKIPPGNQIRDRDKIISLLDIIPEFMALCAIAAPILSDEMSMDLAAQFMMQACLEQYHIFGNLSPEIINEAFAWGPKGIDDAISETNSSKRQSTLPHADPEVHFTSSADAVNVSSWWKKRAEYMDRLQPESGVSHHIHLENLSNAFPIFQFEGMIIDFLTHLIESLEVPVLLQLERGQLGGLSRTESENLKKRVGYWT
ncbi:hypothetical protein VTN02DRAFT_1982 [Thermoascus thermophilus]